MASLPLQLSAHPALPLPQPAPAHLERAEAGAHLERVGGKANIAGEPSVFAGGKLRIALRKQGDEKDAEQKRIDAVKALWEKAKELVPEGASDMRIRFNAARVTITYTDAGGQEHYLDRNAIVQHKEFNDRVEDVRKALRELGGAGPTNTDFLKPHSDLWEGSRPDSARGFLATPRWGILNHLPKIPQDPSKLGFVGLSKVLPPGGVKEADALDMVVATEMYIRRLKTALEAHLKTLTDAKDAKKREKVEELLNKLQKLDRTAVHVAILAWGNPQENADQFGIPAHHLAKGDAAISMAHRLLHAELKPGHDTQRFISALDGGPKELDKRLEMVPYVTRYTKQVGDLLAHQELTSESSAEEFVVHGMLDHDSSRLEARLKALGFEDETITALRGGFIKARADADVAKTEMHRNQPKGSFERRIEVARNRPELAEIFQ